MLEQTKLLCAWNYNQAHKCYSVEKILYSQRPTASHLQVLSIYVPESYMNEDGSLREGSCGVYTTRTAPIIFENNAAGYSEMPDVHPGEERWCGTPYLKQGMVYVSCGCRGRQTRSKVRAKNDEDVVKTGDIVEDEIFREDKYVGKGAAQLVDFKTAIRFLRHHREMLAGDWDRLISVGFSAGGAMSTLLSCTGNSVHFEDLLRENGAYMEESDAVYAAQIYCPITDLEHADMAYEWCFLNSKIAIFPKDNESGELTPFRQALSKKFAKEYIRYFNNMGLKHPKTGAQLQLGEDGRSGSGYEYLMEKLKESYDRYMEYLKPSKDEVVGDITSDGRENTEVGHTKDELMLNDLENYVAHVRTRLKNCPAFDWLEADSCENQLFGNETTNYRHFNEQTAEFIAELREAFPEEYERFYEKYRTCVGDKEQEKQKFLLNPFSFIGTSEKSDMAKHFRICVGSLDADTALTVSMSLALKLAECTDSSVEYRIIWNQPHCEADEPGAVLEWIASLQ